MNFLMLTFITRAGLRFIISPLLVHNPKGSQFVKKGNLFIFLPIPLLPLPTPRSLSLSVHLPVLFMEKMVKESGHWLSAAN